VTGTYRRRAGHTYSLSLYSCFATGRQKTDLRSAQNLGHTDSMCCVIPFYCCKPQGDYTVHSRFFFFFFYNFWILKIFFFLKFIFLLFIFYIFFFFFFFLTQSFAL